MVVESGDRDHVREAGMTDDCICAENDLLVKAARVGWVGDRSASPWKGPCARRVVSPRVTYHSGKLATAARAPVRVQFGLHPG